MGGLLDQRANKLCHALAACLDQNVQISRDDVGDVIHA